MNALEEVYLVARAQTIMDICSTLPGYLFTVLLVDRMRRFAIQLIGFFFMAVFVFVTTFLYDYWIKEDKQIVFMLFYNLTFFFANFGPNVIVFIVSEEIFTARFRFTCIGISSTTDTFGAMVASYGFMYLSQNKDKSKAAVGYPTRIGVKNSLIVLVVINTIAFLFTFLVHKAKGNFLKKTSPEKAETTREC
ncbi:unnamed protein product [Lathyrus sativus]|nr:unnamed protein product [Lathyrus sativus]